MSNWIYQTYVNKCLYNLFVFKILTITGFFPIFNYTCCSTTIDFLLEHTCTTSSGHSYRLRCYILSVERNVVLLSGEHSEVSVTNEKKAHGSCAINIIFMNRNRLAVIFINDSVSETPLLPTQIKGRLQHSILRILWYISALWYSQLNDFFYADVFTAKEIEGINNRRNFTKDRNQQRWTDEIKDKLMYRK